jgi:hypothetical protein
LNDVITRTMFPRQLERLSESTPTWGGQFEWFWGVPETLLAATAQAGQRTVPAAPQPGDPHPQSLGYWGALQALLLRRLGWSRPDLGLTWWYDAGKPTDDPTLKLVSDVWDADGNLDIYLAWLLRLKRSFPVGVPQQPWATPIEDAPPLPDHWQRWLRRFETSPQSTHHAHFTLYGGWDPLHLTGKVGDHDNPDPSAYLLTGAPSTRTAVYVTSAADSWYYDLLNRGNQLPIMGVQSWKVDVVVKPIGFIGTYRKSMKTGLWFTGRHRYHVVGN